MFTGIIESMGTLRSAQSRDRGTHFCIEAPTFASDLSIGDSVCVSGVCLTLVARSGDAMEFDAVEETLHRTTLGDLTTGSRVNLEKPVTLMERLGGHLVQGHVDGVAVVESVETRGMEKWFTFAPPPDLLRYIVEKGSVAIAGVSLTVASVDTRSFSIAIIPHTADVTTFGELEPGMRVNIEVDVFAKYVEKLVAAYASVGSA